MKISLVKASQMPAAPNDPILTTCGVGFYLEAIVKVKHPVLMRELVYLALPRLLGNTCLRQC